MSASGGYEKPKVTNARNVTATTRDGGGYTNLEHSPEPSRTPILTQEKDSVGDTGSGAEVNPQATSCLMRDCMSLKAVFLSPINILLIFVPLGIVCHYKEMNCGLIFCFNFLAVIPLAGILGVATESLSEHTGETIGGLINASFGNAVEMIITVDAIKEGLCGVVQGGLVGSILSNLLLVLGMAFVAGGIEREESCFNNAAAGANSSLLLLAALGVIMPTLFAHIQDVEEEAALKVSRWCSVIMAVVYMFFLFFQLKTHRHQFVPTDAGMDSGGEEDVAIELSIATSVGLLLAATLIIAQLSEFLVGSIEHVSEDYGVPKAFIGLILLPIVGNAAEHMTAVSTAYKGKMDLSLGVAVGSSTQVALLIVPFAILVGWAYDQPMSLNFGSFYAGTMILSVFLINQVLGDSKGNWLEGLMLLATYLMVAVMCWFVPDTE